MPPLQASRPLSTKSPKRNEIVVFLIVRDSACSECGDELARGQLLRLEGDQPLCMTCADLDHLVFLPSGNTALTRRSTKYSKLRAVVVRFSRARKRYERQGILVEEPAIERAEAECLADSDARAAARERAAERRALLDARYVVSFEERIANLFPQSPPKERRSIAEHACEIHSGRVGRSAAARHLEASAVELAVQAHVRHAHTEYDELLVGGMSRQQARARVAHTIGDVLKSWTTSGR